ncbi:hypothetical protein RDI58_008382 [Solanum bulbocastanum]|uniref:Uncharacterized protein n=1 Tax=Solanum bulbocastanum TaxID=147425 RepID=A0AAN8TY87_SOLBU
MTTTTKCLFLLCLSMVPFVVFSSTFTSQNPIDLPSAKPVPVLDTTDGEFRYDQVGPKGTPVRLLTPSRFGPLVGNFSLDFDFEKVQD